MAISKSREVTLTFNVEDGKAKKSIDELNKGVKETKKSAEGASDAFGLLGTKANMAIGAVKGVVQGVGNFASSLKTLRGAIIATGVGALVVALGSLVAYFTETKRGAEKLERITAYLGAAFGVLTDALAGVGEAMINAFENPQKAVADLWTSIKTNLVNRVDGLLNTFRGLGDTIKAAFELDWEGVKKGAEETAWAYQQVFTGVTEEQWGKAADAIGDLAQKTNDAADAAVKLKASEQALRDSNRALNVEFAKRRAEIKELNKIAEDTSKSDDVRMKAAEDAIAIEQRLMEQKIANAEENYRISLQQSQLADSSAEDLDRVAEAEIALYDLQRESLELQTTLQNKLNTIKDQTAAKAEAQRQKELEAEAKLMEEIRLLNEAYIKEQDDLDAVRLALMEEGIDKELAAVDAKYEALFEKAHNNAELEKQLIQAQQDEINAIKEKAREEDAKKVVESETNITNLKYKTAKEGIESLNSLIDTSSKEGFEASKNLTASVALMDTFASANAAFKSTVGLLGPVGATLAAASAVVAGLANVKKIKSQKFGGGGSASASAPSAPSVGNLNQQQAPQPDTSYLGQQSKEQFPVKAYVMGNDVRSASEAQQKILDQASL